MESSEEETEISEANRDSDSPELVRIPEKVEERPRRSRYGRVYKPNTKYRDYDMN